MRHLFIISIIAASALIFCSCGSEEKPTLSARLDKYREIYSGWIDLSADIDNYQDYGYDSKEELERFIKDVNRNAFPGDLREEISDKKITSAKKMDEEAPKKGLVIQFKDILHNATKNGGEKGFTIHDSMDIGVHFIDGLTGDEIFATNINIKSKNKWGFSSPGFEGRTEAMLEKLAQSISEIID